MVMRLCHDVSPKTTMHSIKEITGHTYNPAQRHSGTIIKSSNWRKCATYISSIVARAGTEPQVERTIF
jgi:hypothetical protein